MNVIAKKKFGQNFLVNLTLQSRVIDEFTKLIQKYPSKSILEIGPGQGDLTKHLMDLSLPLTCLEIDPEVIDFLPRQSWFDPQKINLLSSDALQAFAIPNNPILPPSFALFASLPYNVGSRILVETGINYHTTPLCVIVQKEVAQKTKLNAKITFFGLWLNLFWNCKVAFDISSGNFRPSPKVTSSVLVCEPKTELPLPELETLEGRIKIKDLIHQLLQMPNKTIANNLKQAGYSKDQIREVLEKIQEGDEARLTRQNWLEVIKILLELKK